jgi:hypothetical protein
MECGRGITCLRGGTRKSSPGIPRFRIAGALADDSATAPEGPIHGSKCRSIFASYFVPPTVRIRCRQIGRRRLTHERRSLRRNCRAATAASPPVNHGTHHAVSFAVIAAEFSDCHRLDLADAFSAQTQPVADLSEGERLAVQAIA